MNVMGARWLLDVAASVLANRVGRLGKYLKNQLFYRTFNTCVYSNTCVPSYIILSFVLNSNFLDGQIQHLIYSKQW